MKGPHDVLLDDEGARSTPESQRIQGVVVRLSDLRFCDVRALCDLLDFGNEARENGRDMAVHDANRLIQKLTRLIDADRVLRFE